MGCFLRSIGCAVVLGALAAVAWIYRDQIPFLHRDTTPGAASTVGWEPLTPEGAARAKSSVAALGGKTGPVFTNVKAGDLSAYVFQELSRQLPPSAQNTEAAVIGDELCVRATVRLSDFGGAGALGPLASVLGDREQMQFCGTMNVLRAGLAEYHVKSLKLRELSIPSGAIPKLLRKIEQGGRPAGLADDALPLKVPSFIGDVRINRGRVTLYKTTG
ncbi:MAG: hypothetical protein M3081_06730 [Gemmatimonadota bacterium]|nr:hypothetical protein [Gemmatimonadota bacterium]